MLTLASYIFQVLFRKVNSTSVKYILLLKVTKLRHQLIFLFLVVLDQFLYPSADQILFLEHSRTLFNIIENKNLSQIFFFYQTQTILLIWPKSTTKYFLSKCPYLLSLLFIKLSYQLYTVVQTRKSFIEIIKSFDTQLFASPVLLTKFGFSVSILSVSRFHHLV